LTVSIDIRNSKTFELTPLFIDQIPEQANEASPNTGSQASWNFASRLVDECTRHHNLCNKFRNKDQWLPTRLLDLGESTVLPKVRLIHTARIHTGARYTALSHCWGDGRCVKLDSTNIESMQQVIPDPPPRKTYLDAITVTKVYL
jgi:hypothetical protein